jgi:hypothetical protein
MPATRGRPRRLSDTDVQRLLDLLKGADSVELKLTVPDSDLRSAVAALGMDPLEGQIRQVYFFDKLFSKEQRAFFAAHAPEGVGLDGLSILGPINLLKLKFTPGDFGRRVGTRTCPSR